MSKAWEVNFDGLIGPSHNYGGLSDGNLASSENEGLVSRPKEAALQGLEKMRLLVKAGLKQGVLPPLERPDYYFLSDCGFGDWLWEDFGVPDPYKIIPEVIRTEPNLLKTAYSASSMWAANAATVSPSVDTLTGELTLTAANLSTMLHRSIEYDQTNNLLRHIFQRAYREKDPFFRICPGLPAYPDFSDEGAANHVRLCAEHGAQGVELFVYGREAGESIARQARKAIAAGAFHNDVVCVGTLETLFFHEFAFEDTEATLADLRKASKGLFELKPVMVPDAEVPLADAISSYLFNSQLLQWPGEDRLVLLAPTETRDTPSTAAYCEKLVAGNGPIGRVQYVDVRQSMRNGGGPACLRLRVVMTEKEIAATHQGMFLDEDKIDALQAVVRAHYRDELSPADLADPEFSKECFAARAAILDVLDYST